MGKQDRLRIERIRRGEEKSISQLRKEERERDEKREEETASQAKE